MGYLLLQGASVQMVVHWPNLMNAAILFPVEGGLMGVFELGGLFLVTVAKPCCIH